MEVEVKEDGDEKEEEEGGASKWDACKSKRNGTEWRSAVHPEEDALGALTAR